MHIAYGIVAALYTAFMLFAGIMKLVRTPEQLEPMMHWAVDLPPGLVKLIGGLEVLGAIGLILPPLLHIAPVLALAAAAGFAVLQILATRVHVRRGEPPTMNLVLIALAGVLIWLSTGWL